ncbi:MAG: Fpg/Nei family DNA glycosylase [Candidatus Saccharimonadales bacterium]
MPELPEVETVRRGLSRLIVGKTIAHVSFDTPKSFPNPSSEVDQFLVGASVTAVHRRAKVLLIELSSGYTLVTHMKMTGQLVFVEHEQREEGRKKREKNTVTALHLPSAIYPLPSRAAKLRFGGGHPNYSLVGELPDKSTRVILTFQDETHLFFNDQRKFGWMRLMPSIELPNIDFMKRLGPEPLEDDFTPEILYERLQRRKNTSIKAALLDQSVVAGIGNIYADESLWGARLHPATLVRNLPKSKIQNLTSEIKAVMLLSIKKGGSTDKNYVDAEGKKGSYLTFANVFRREGQACPRCGRAIIKLRVAGRGTHICPHCQRIPDLGGPS